MRIAESETSKIFREPHAAHPAPHLALVVSIRNCDCLNFLQCPSRSVAQGRLDVMLLRATATMEDEEERLCVKGLWNSGPCGLNL